MSERVWIVSRPWRKHWGGQLGPLRAGHSLRHGMRYVEVGVGRLLLRVTWGRSNAARWRTFTTEVIWFDRDPDRSD